MNERILAKGTKEEIYEIFKNATEKSTGKTIEKNIPVDEVKKKWDMNDKIIETFVENIKQDRKLRNTYAVILMVILGLELIALLVFFYLKGKGVLNYSDATFNIFVTGGIAEIFVLVKVIVEYLFKDNLTETLKIIIELNNKNGKESNELKEN